MAYNALEHLTGTPLARNTANADHRQRSRPVRRCLNPLEGIIQYKKVGEDMMSKNSLIKTCANLLADPKYDGMGK